MMSYEEYRKKIINLLPGTIFKSTDAKEFVEESLKELRKIKDSEKELGIDIPTLISALKNGIWVKTRNGISQHFTISVRKWLQTDTYCLYYRPYTHVWFKDYGKTWALTREELEKSKKDQ